MLSRSEKSRKEGKKKKEATACFLSMQRRGKSVKRTIISLEFGCRDRREEEVSPFYVFSPEKTAFLHLASAPFKEGGKKRDYLAFHLDSQDVI